MDSYHYVNHRASDSICRKWCNPAPLDGSAPNMVILETDERGGGLIASVHSIHKLVNN